MAHDHSEALCEHVWPSIHLFTHSCGNVYTSPVGVTCHLAELTSVWKEEGKPAEGSVEFCLSVPNPNLSIVLLQFFCIDCITLTLLGSFRP